MFTVRCDNRRGPKTAGNGFRKQGPWQQSPKRMKQLRARAFALRDVFTDLLRGMHMAEESADIPPPAERHMGAVEEVASPAAPARPELPAYE